jgi:hypothetical protein
VKSGERGKHCTDADIKRIVGYSVKKAATGPKAGQEWGRKENKLSQVMQERAILDVIKGM